MNYDVLVIGGGAAGMMAAGTAAQNGRKTILVEKNPVLGKKLLITGKGRCNLANCCDIPELIENIPTNGKFLINAFYRFNSYDAISFFTDLGLEIKIERGNRVFPVSDRAQDVVRALIRFVYKNKVEVLHRAVDSVQKFGSLFAVKLIDGTVIRAEKLIIATGGKTYPGTGSTGDGYKFAKIFGHQITRFKPSLVPIEAQEFIQSGRRSQPFAANENSIAGSEAKPVQVQALQGLSLKNVKITIFDRSDKEVYAEFGELLFTHFGVSGPVILSASSHLGKIEEHRLSIDLKPALEEDTLDLRLQKEFKENSQRQFQNVLKNLLPTTLIPVFIFLSGISAEKKAGQISRPERKLIVNLLKNFQIRLNKFRPLQEAIITSGGVDVSEIDPKTMESKLVPNLFFAGEVIDVDAYTGGFNLQIAWSTAFAAGKSV